MMKSEAELIHQYVEKKRNGMSYSDIRNELYEKGFDKVTVDFLINQIDDQILVGDLNSVTGSLTKEYRYFAWALVLFSIVASVVSYYYYSVLFISAGLLIGGVTILFLIRRNHKQTNIFQDSRDKYPRNKFRRN